MDLSIAQFKAEFLDRLEKLHGKTFEETSTCERYKALSGLVRDYIAKQWIEADRQRQQEGQKQVYYLSIEFLLGRMLGLNLMNLGLYDTCAAALTELGANIKDIESAEEDPGLGNGGLGRLAACYLDSMAAESLPGHGCGIRYRYGFFEQDVVDGYQVEVPDNWLTDGFSWEFRRREEAVPIHFGGSVRVEANGKLRYYHENYESVLAVPYDVPVVGYQNGTVNTLRLWSAEPAKADFVCSAFNRNDCLKVIDYKNSVETISNVLYPDDSNYEGKVLRLKQQYFLVSASLQNIIAKFKQGRLPMSSLPDQVAVHINDTHPTLAVPELMRILIDEEGLGWDEAWNITVSSLSYTNHTVLPEALEKWPENLFQQLLPRIYMIVNEINERFCQELWDRYPGQWDRIRSMAVLADGNVHMAHLAIVGSHSVNGVAQIHTEILKNKVMHGFYHFYPDKFNNKTNGVAHRRFLIKCNPQLTEVINDAVGTDWIHYPCDLLGLLKYENDDTFLNSLAAVKRHHKVVLARYIKDWNGFYVDPDSIFDAQIKRFHGYKRQTMNVLHIMHLYNRLRENPDMDLAPRTFIFGGKAAPGYAQAKRTIKLINTLSSMINNDKSIRDKIKVVFLENYNVSLAEMIIPATDVSEQIPAASREACGTSNMKFMMNGGVTIGTMDGGNIEIRNAVGDDNIITFGLTAEEVMDYYQNGGYNPWDIYNSDQRVKTVLDQLINGFLPTGPDEFRPLFDAFLYHGDQFFVLKDFAAYVDAQIRVEKLYRDKKTWGNMCIHNIAHSGKFSGDRTFTEYSMDIWQMRPAVPVRCYCRSDDAFAKLVHGCAMPRQATGPNTFPS
ncbi:MAG: glycogen/starch/alpha-glucan phosphorylase [Negativicutes bacterium]|nr:glycogen/starch/alpha-glucan phosphorylase [Negativicutes bacterium]MDR3590730.1 glycogen/starch/alpha-glucan phosphorylase [Negativicutes bacterium]